MFQDVINCRRGNEETGYRICSIIVDSRMSSCAYEGKTAFNGVVIYNWYFEMWNKKEALMAIKKYYEQYYEPDDRLVAFKIEFKCWDFDKYQNIIYKCLENHFLKLEYMGK